VFCVQGPLRAHRADVGAHAAHRGVDRGGCDRRVTTRDRGVSRVLAVLGVSGVCVTSRVERRRLNTANGVPSTPRTIMFPEPFPPSSLAHHREFQVVAFADIRTYYLEHFHIGDVRGRTEGHRVRTRRGRCGACLSIFVHRSTRWKASFLPRTTSLPSRSGRQCRTTCL